jgi:hypothetical protein
MLALSRELDVQYKTAFVAARQQSWPVSDT